MLYKFEVCARKWSKKHRLISTCSSMIGIVSTGIKCANVAMHCEHTNRTCERRFHKREI